MSNSSLVFALSALKKANTANERIDALPLPMVFKGSLGTGGTISTLPTASSENEGFVYIVITDGTYAGQSAKAGDTFVSDGSAWVLIPAGDEPSVIDDSVTSTALTWSSEKIYNDLAIKTLSYIGNDETSKSIEFPETPSLILSIKSTSTNQFQIINSLPFGWNIQSSVPILITPTNQTAPTVASCDVSFSDNVMTISGTTAARTFNALNATTTIYYI